MTPSVETHVKALIRRRYAHLAASAGAMTDGRLQALRAGYTPQSLARIPEALVQNWSGCGALAECVMLEGVDTVVDFGCGGGLDAWLIATAPVAPRRVIAIDLTPEMLAGLNEVRSERASCALRAVAADMELLPLANACCDLVIANASFNLALDPDKVFAEAARILRPGGRLHLMELVREGALPAELLADPMGHGTSLGGVKQEDEIYRALKGAGFVDVVLHGRRTFPPVMVVQIEARVPAMQ